MKSRRLLVVFGALLLLAAGGAAALLLSGRRNVTTTSKAAYEAYQEALANQRRFYSKEARVGFARALELDPHFAMAMLGLSHEAKDEDQQVALVKRAAREEARLTERERLHVRLELAWVEKRTQDTVKIAEELHRRYPDDVRGASVLAASQLQKGENEKGIRILQELLAVDPNNAEAYNLIGYYYGYRGDYEKAVEALTKYKFISPDNANPFDSLGEVQAYSGRYNEALENLHRALAIKPDFVESYRHLGVAYEGMGEYTKAFDSYVKAAELSEQNGRRRDFLYGALRAACESQDAGRVAEIHSRLAAVPAGKHAEIETLFADTALDVCSGRPAAALPRLEVLKVKLAEVPAKEPQLSGYKPHYAVLNFLTALAFEKMGKTEEALAAWKLNAEPPNPYRDFMERRNIYEARAHVAEILARRGELDAAEKLIAENRKWNPSWAPTRPQEMAVAELRREKVLAAGK
jgi:tetratricopeptide (TPR) repeat protein